MWPLGRLADVQIMGNAKPRRRARVGLAGVFLALTFGVFVGYGAFAAATRRYVITRPSVMRWLRRGFAGAFAALGVRLALSDR